MTEQNSIWVFIEQTEGKIADVSLELTGKARELADQLGYDVVGLVFGHDVEPLAQQVIERGADRVLLADHPELADYRTLPYARVAIAEAKARKPEIFLIGGTPNGRDLAPRVASALRCGLTADCTDLQIGEYTIKKENKTYPNLLYQIRPAFGGNLIATIVNPKTRPQMATVREGVMRLPAAQPGRKGTIEKIVPAFEPGDFALEVLSRQLRQSTVHLKEAPVVVSGGAGIGSAEDFALLRDLANLLGGEVGAPRRRGCRHDRAAAPGRPDRHHGPATPLHRGRDLGRHPASGRHGPVLQDHRHQHRLERADVPDRPLPHRRRRCRGAPPDHQSPA